MDNNSRSASSQNTYVSPSGQVSITISSPDLWRQQSRAESCDMWFPKIVVADLEPAFDFMMRMMPMSPALAAAADASFLLNLGQHFKDERLHRLGRTYHGCALVLLRRELEQPADRRNRALLAAIQVLQVDDSLTSMSTSIDSVAAHSKGFTSLIRNAREDESEGELDEEYEHMLSANFHLFHFWAGLRDCTSIRCFPSTTGTVLTAIAEQIPGILESVEQSLRTGIEKSPAEAIELLEKLSRLEQDLRSWTTSWSPCMRLTPYAIVPSTDLLPEKIVDRRVWRTFPASMSFEHFHHARDHAECSASLLKVREAMADLGSAAAHGVLPSDGLDPYSSITSCADSLCLDIPYFLKLEHGSYGRIMATGPLHVASSWYSRLQAHGSSRMAAKLQWCRQIEAYIRTRGTRTW